MLFECNYSNTSNWIYVCMYNYINVCMYVCMYVCTYYVNMILEEQMYVCMYVCMHACMYTLWDITSFIGQYERVHVVDVSIVV